MKPNSLAALPRLLKDGPFTAHNSRMLRQRTEIIKLPLANPPDEKKIGELNALAASYPFCILYRPKKHDTL